MVELLFWISIATIIYTYLAFPALLFLRGWIWRRPVKRGAVTPTVTLIIAAHNEAAHIGRKLENLLSLDYPRDRLSIIVASDGSEDGTNEVVSQYEARGIKLLPLPRRGKIPTLNAAVFNSTSEILVFSDANSMYALRAIRVLVRPFADPSVGGVAGSQCYVRDLTGSSASMGERTYWNFDQRLKLWQSQSGSVTSATGAIYAIRRELFEPIPSGVGDDAVNSYRVVARHYRMVFEPKAIAYEPVAPSSSAEFQRKVRICVRGLRGLLAVPELLNPLRYGFYSLQLFSHKLLRWLMAWPLLALFFSSLWLSSTSSLYQIAASGQIIFYGLAVSVFLIRQWKIATAKIFKLLTLPFYFCLANSAFLVAQLRVVQGQRIDLWEVRRNQHG